jgi:hypothetical protein
MLFMPIHIQRILTSSLSGSVYLLNAVTILGTPFEKLKLEQ